MFNYLINEIKKMEGNVLAIGVDDKLISVLKKNKKINAYELSKSDSFVMFQKKKRKLKGGKSINIKKLHKCFNKESINYIICDYNDILKYYKYVFKDSVYLSKGKLYFYASNDIDMDYLMKYKRYNSNISVKEYENTKLVIIDNASANTTKLKNFIYLISDTFSNFIDFISNILVG